MRLTPAICVATFSVFFCCFQAAAQTTGAAANFLGFDSTTKGDWQAVYGADGYVLAAVPTEKIPGYATFQVQNAANYTWNLSTIDPRALQVPGGPGGIAATWYSTWTFNFDVNFTDEGTHQLALYSLDWDNAGRVETIQIVDGNTNMQLDSRSISNFSTGTYLVWNMSGHVKINVTLVGGVNPVVSGVFWGEGSGGRATATFMPPADTITGGSWQGKYGSDGAAIAGVPSLTVPSYAGLTVNNATPYVWQQLSSDPRALETGLGALQTATTWYGNNGFNFLLNLTDGCAHQIALYAVDWDLEGRVETITITDPSNGNNVLDTRTISNFENGVYLVWNITGNVGIQVTDSSGSNAVVSGLFFGVAPAQLSTNISSLNFGNVAVGTLVANNVTLTNTGNSNLTIANVSVAGPGFNANGNSGAIVAPNQSLMMSVTFDPQASGFSNGTVSITSNATDSLLQIGLSGTGSVQHSVSLNWSASTSSVTGYFIYRSTGRNPFTKLNSSPYASLTYTDTTVVSGQTYTYAITAVDSTNLESAFSNEVSAPIPSP